MRMLFICLGIMLCLSACSDSTIKDSITEERVEMLEHTSGGQWIFNNEGSDWMSGKHGEYQGELVIDGDYYSSHKVARGDVVYYKVPSFDASKIRATPREFEIARVIALPGERFSIENGQYYINGKKLDTFYGHVMYWGLTKKEVLASLKDSKSGLADTEETRTFIQDYFSQNVKEIQIPEDSYYLLGDALHRSVSSNIFGAINEGLIKGKVMGQLKK
ncbi:signal peptidase I [Paenibacillus sp. MMS18-CY102]|uniref:signal peptidase I n=1 Tax=Paenibacillus sp. MMS18-CY102 TaxID=2682849 RepID=UPI0013666A6E|nr:signal peptidase I [Paenibacillus sp. MMS18-CY102]MWC28605.1 signal peptidase I [Paenibacillus sp. MMS18-CY102]